MDRTLRRGAAGRRLLDDAPAIVGEVQMAVDYRLTADEVAWEHILTCRTRPTTVEVSAVVDA